MLCTPSDLCPQSRSLPNDLSLDCINHMIVDCITGQNLLDLHQFDSENQNDVVLAI